MKSRNLCETKPKPKIFPCFGPNFSERPSEFLHLRYKAYPDNDHMAKFRAYRPRELGDFVQK